MIGETHRPEPPPRALLRGDATEAVAPEPERDVVERAQVREEEVVLEDDPDRALLGRDEDAGAVVEHGVVEDDAAVFDRGEAGERAEERGLPRAVRTEDPHGLTRPDPDRRVEVEGAEGERDVRVEAHVTPNHRSRSSASTPTQTARRTTLSPIAMPGSVSSSR